MAILTQGTLTSEVESALSLKTAINAATAEGKLIDMIIQAAEAFIKLEINRNFEQQTLTDEAYDIDIDQPDILLTDRPATSVASVKVVTSRDANGNVDGTTTVNKNEYVIDKNAGIITLDIAGVLGLASGGRFPRGPQTVLVTWTGGYTPTEISTSAKNEVRTLKHLLLSIIQREYKTRKEGLAHISSISLGDESAQIQFDLTAFEKRLLNQLRR